MSEKPTKKEVLQGEDIVDAFTANDMNRACNEIHDQWQAYHENVLRTEKKALLERLRKKIGSAGHLYMSVDAIISEELAKMEEDQ